MHDPFPIPPPPFLNKLAKPLADRLSFQTLTLHAHEVLLAALFYHTIYLVISPRISKILFPRIYPSLSPKVRLNWDVHVVSLVQSLLINALAIWVSIVDDERNAMDWRGRLWGYTGACGLVQAFACGYFLWDLWISTRHVGIFGIGLLAHAVSALAVFSLGFRPFLNYYAPTFILYELSSPFLNVHWFCDKLGLTGSKLQLYNGFLLLATFFGSRLIWGTIQSFQVAFDVLRSITSDGNELFANVDDPELMQYAGTKPTVPAWLAGSYLVANLVLHTLNFYWFGKMIETVRKRFDPPIGTKGLSEKGKPAGGDKDGEEEEEVVLVEGIEIKADGAVDGEATSSTFESREVRTTRKR